MKQFINDLAYGLYFVAFGSVFAAALYELFVLFAGDFWLAMMCGVGSYIVYKLTLTEEKPTEERDTRPMSEQLSDLIDNGPKKETR